MDERVKLRKEVKRYRGTITECARRVGCSRWWVHLVLDGKYDDLRVLEAAYQIVAERKKKEEELLAKIASL